MCTCVGVWLYMNKSGRRMCSGQAEEEDAYFIGNQVDLSRARHILQRLR